MSLVPPNLGVGPTPPEDEQQQALADQYRDTVADIQSRLFDKAVTYSNLIMAAGYAGGFTIWGNIKEQLPACANIWIALLLGISLSIFVFYQVWKMASHVLHFLSVREILRDNLSLGQFFKKYNEFQKKTERSSFRSSILYGSICFVLCVLPALGALGLLFYNLTATVAVWPMWPH